MDDVRQQLLPAFLQEVQTKLLVMDSFLGTRASKDCDLSALEEAFRAMQTLKETAGLLRADAVRVVAVRVAGILEKHLLRNSCPTQAEYDALNFAREKIADLIDCFELSRVEPTGLLSGILRALDLIEALPGRPALATGPGAVCAAEDPFAEDCVFDSPDAAFLAGQDGAKIPDDPFTEDHHFGLAGSRAALVADGRSAKTEEPPGFDPFAADPDF